MSTIELFLVLIPSADNSKCLISSAQLMNEWIKSSDKPNLVSVRSQIFIYRILEIIVQ